MERNRVLIAYGWSMIPVILPGMRVNIEPLEKKNLKAGLIYLVRQNEKRMFLHRFSHFDSKFLYFKGDYNIFFEKQGDFDSVKGVLKGITVKYIYIPTDSLIFSIYQRIMKLGLKIYRIHFIKHFLKIETE